MTTAVQERATESPPDDRKIVPVRHYGQWAAGSLGAVVIVWLAWSLATNKNIDYSVIPEYFVNSSVLEGLLATFEMAIVSMIIGMVVGVLVAVARMSNNTLLSGFALIYVWFFRGVPVLVQLLIWGNFALLFPILSIGIPFTEISFVSAETNLVINVFVAVCLGLGLSEGAYMAEIVRGGILGVDRGQSEAAMALGMGGRQIMWRIVLPQTARIIIPPTGNQFITLVKSTSLVAVIAGGDLLTRVQDIAANNFKTIEMLMVATIWYLLIVTVLSIGQHYLEKAVSKGRR